MIALYRGNPDDGGVFVGYYDSVPDVQCAIVDDSKKHEAGNSYYLVGDDDSESLVRE